MSADRGAALLETLVALALTALLAGAIAATARFGLDAIDRAAARSEGGGAALSTERRLRETLARIAAEGPVSGGPGTLVFRGVARDGEGGWRDGLWRLEADERGLTFARCEPAPGRLRCGAAETIDGGAHWRFAYAGADGAERAEWPEGPPPALVILRGAEAVVAAAPRASAP